jgi:NADH:ubiquinone oxidoreductase subunit C
MQLFIVFEKISIQSWTSKINKPNFFFIFISQKWFNSINEFFKFELNFSNSFLIDSSAIDMTNYKNTTFFNKINFNNSLIIFYIYYFYFLKIKISLFYISNTFTKNELISIDKIYLNSNWIERETAEMFGLNFYFKKDVRKLLMDYSFIENPLLKSYPTEGRVDVFYNFFEDQVIANFNESIEL